MAGDGDERPLRARAALMNEASHELLPGPGLAFYD
jgi:hypothetical protein